MNNKSVDALSTNQSTGQEVHTMNVPSSQENNSNMGLQKTYAPQAGNIVRNNSPANKVLECLRIGGTEVLKTFPSGSVAAALLNVSQSGIYIYLYIYIYIYINIYIYLHVYRHFSVL
jgi:hypothetical protein